MTVRRLVGLSAAAFLLAAACSSSGDSATSTESAATSVEDNGTTGAEGGDDGATGTAEPLPTDAEPLPTDSAPAAADSEASEAVQVEVATSDGETLTAKYTATEGAPGVVLGHMRGTGKETWDAFAKAVSDAGFSVLAIDSRGYGGSTGEADTNLDIDLAAGVDFLRQQGAPSVAVVGASMNGTATMVLGSQIDVAGVATLSAPGQFGPLDAVAASAAVTEPALVIVAEDDEPYASDAFTIVPAGGQLRQFPGSAHGTNLFSDHDAALTSALIAFLSEVTG